MSAEEQQQQEQEYFLELGDIIKLGAPDPIVLLIK